MPENEVLVRLARLRYSQRCPLQTRGDMVKHGGERYLVGGDRSRELSCFRPDSIYEVLDVSRSPIYCWGGVG